MYIYIYIKDVKIDLKIISWVFFFFLEDVLMDWKPRYSGQIKFIGNH